MSIQADPESIEQIRERLRKMSDLEFTSIWSIRQSDGMMGLCDYGRN